jgi:hypothetical protein
VVNKEENDEEDAKKEGARKDENEDAKKEGAKNDEEEDQKHQLEDTAEAGGGREG